MKRIKLTKCTFVVGIGCFIILLTILGLGLYFALQNLSSEQDINSDIELESTKELSDPISNLVSSLGEKPTETSDDAEPQITQAPQTSFEVGRLLRSWVSKSQAYLLSNSTVGTNESNVFHNIESLCSQLYTEPNNTELLNTYIEYIKVHLLGYPVIFPDIDPDLLSDIAGIRDGMDFEWCVYFINNWGSEYYVSLFASSHIPAKIEEIEKIKADGQSPTHEAVEELFEETYKIYEDYNEWLEHWYELANASRPSKNG